LGPAQVATDQSGHRFTIYHAAIDLTLDSSACQVRGLPAQLTCTPQTEYNQGLGSPFESKDES